METNNFNCMNKNSNFVTTTEDLKHRILKIFDKYSDIFTIKANFIKEQLQWNYTKSMIKDAIIKLDEDGLFYLKKYKTEFYNKPSEIKFDFIFDVSKISKLN